MKIKSIYGLAVAVLFVCSCQSGSYKVQGYAHDFAEGDTIFLTKAADTTSQVRYTLVADGKFYFEGEADKVTLYEIYAGSDSRESISFFNVPGTTTVELNRKPKPSRVSGTTVNNSWQQLADSIDDYASQMEILLRMPSNDTLSIRQRTLAVDSLHRQMSDCILHTAGRNKDNPLGQYIHAYYKAPEFK
jgi:hypothetical protein